MAAKGGDFRYLRQPFVQSTDLKSPTFTSFLKRIKIGDPA